MKIKNERLEFVEHSIISMGQVFESEGSYFIKTCICDSKGNPYSINLATGNHYLLDPTDKCVVVDATLVVK